MSTSLQLLILDDDETFRERLAKAMRHLGYEVATAAAVGELAMLLEGFKPTHALLDLRMPGGSGLDAISLVRRASPDARILLLSGYGSISDAVTALRLGADDFLVKPLDAGQIDRALRGTKASVDDSSDSSISLARIEWEHMQQVLRDCGGNISETARRLGIERRTLQRKLNKVPPQR